MVNKFSRTVAGASIVITIIGLLSRGFGFLREVIFAAFFGLGSDFEVYLIASVFPVTINTVLLYLGQNYYIPIYSRIKNEGIKKETELFVQVVTLFFFGGFILAVILFAFSSYILTFYLSSSDPTKVRTALIIFRIFIFTLPINAAISIISAHLQSQKKFAIPAFAQLATNFSVIILIPLLSNKMGTLIIPITYLIGSILQMAFLLSKIKNSLTTERKLFFSDLFSQFSKYVNSNLLLIIVIEIIGQFYLIIDRYFFDKVEPGGIAALNYAITVFYLPVAILTVALSTAIFPVFSEHLQRKNSFEFVKKINDSISINTFLFAPIFILFSFYGDFVIRLFFQRGNFSFIDTQMTFSALQYFSLSIIFYSIYAIFNKIFYGAKLVKQLLFISLIGVTIKFIFNFILVVPMQQDGLALSSSISYSFLCIAALFVLVNNLKISLYRFFWKSFSITLINALFSFSITTIIVKSVYIESNVVQLIRIFIFLSVYFFNANWFKDYSINLLKEVWVSYRKSLVHID
jgi:putative peptidoglycan lipid II flippase